MAFLRHWLQFWQLRTWIHDNLCDLTIKSDTGQHSQFLQCFFLLFAIFLLTCTYWVDRSSCLDNAVSRVKGNLGRTSLTQNVTFVGFTWVPCCQGILSAIRLHHPWIWETIKQQREKTVKKMENPSLFVSFLNKSMLSRREPKKRIIGPREIPAWGLNYKLEGWWKIRIRIRFEGGWWLGLAENQSCSRSVVFQCIIEC